MNQTDFLKSCEAGAGKTGRPEWEQGENKCYLAFGCCGWAIDWVNPPFDEDERFLASELHDHISDHEAACLWAEHLREWLASQDIGVNGTSSPAGHSYCIYHSNEDAWLFEGQWRSTGEMVIYTDYFDALIAARDAAEVPHAV